MAETEPAWRPVGAAADFAADQPVAVEVDGTPVCVVRSAADGRIHALHDVCSHANVALSEGEVVDGDDRMLAARLDASTWPPASPPACPPCDPVPVYPSRSRATTCLVAVNVGV